MVIDCEVFFLKIFQNHQWFLADFFDNCYTKCCKFRIKIFIFLTLNKLYSSRGFAFCFYKKYFRCVTLWSTISLAWFGVVDKLPFPLHPSVSFVTLAQFHFGSHTCGFRPALASPQTSFGRKECVTNEPQRTSAGSMGGYQGQNSVFLFCCAIVLFCCFVMMFCHSVLTFYRSVVGA